MTIEEANTLRGRPLTQEERAILAMTAQGLTNRQTAVQLGQDEGAVKRAKLIIWAKLGAVNAPQAVALALMQGKLKISAGSLNLASKLGAGCVRMSKVGTERAVGSGDAEG